MSSKLDIYKIVCVHLGEPPVASLVANAKIVGLLDAIYVATRDELLRDHPWNFAIVREALTQTTTPTFGYDYAYTIPSECLRVIEVDEANPYVVEGQTILSDESTLSLRYVSRVTDESLWDVKFTAAFAATLAAKICYNLTGSHTREMDLFELAKTYLPSAKAVGGIEEPTEDTNTWAESMV